MSNYPTTLNISQGDISLCCRAVSESVGGFKFRFLNEEIRPEAKLKKGFNIVSEAEEDASKRLDRTELTRTTRASRGDFGADRSDRTATTSKPAFSILAPPELKVSVSSS